MKKIKFIPIYAKAYLYGVNLLLLSSFVFLFARVLILYFWGPEKVWQTHISDVMSGLYVGFLFDMKIVSLLFAPAYLLSLLLLWPNLRRYHSTYLKFARYYGYFLFFIFLTLSIGNFYYYLTYQNHIDEFAFAFMEGEPTAALWTIWKDYPVIEVLAFLVATVWLYSQVNNWLSQKIPETSTVKKIRTHSLWITLGFIGSVIFYAIAIRGSIGDFPLSRNRARVSRVRVINAIIPNGPFALTWSIQDRWKQEEIPIANEQKGRKLYNQFYGKSISQRRWKPELFFTQTHKNLFVENHPPQVVFTLMEGLGSQLLDWQKKDFDILGKFKKHYQSDFTFHNFLSGDNGTFPSLIRLLVSSRYVTLPRSKARRHFFKTSLTRPFRSQSYKTYFVTSGSAAWRSLDEFLLANGFDEVIDASNLKRHYPDVRERIWGVDDEWAFHYAYELLEKAQKSGDKIFLFIMTISNHPPYEIPSSYQPFPLLAPEQVTRHLMDRSEKEKKQILKAYQYANSSFGEFLSQVKSSPFKDQVIVAASGDHNLRHLIYKNERDMVNRLRVPFYLYVPSNYQNNLNYNSERIGSHKDIFPTLFHLSLSNTPYLDLGQNLLAEHLRPEHNFAFNENLAVNHLGGVTLDSKSVFYPWASKRNSQVKVGIEKSKSSDQLYRHAIAFRDILNWLSAYQINDFEAFDSIYK